MSYYKEANEKNDDKKDEKYTRVFESESVNAKLIL